MKHRINDLCYDELRVMTIELYEALDECMPIGPPKRLLNAKMAFHELPTAVDKLRDWMRENGFKLGASTNLDKTGVVSIRRCGGIEFWEPEENRNG